MKFTFERILIYVFIVFLIGIAVIGYATYKGSAALKKSSEWLQHTQEVLRESDKVLAIAKDIGGERAYLNTRDKSFLEPYNNARESIFIEIGVLKGLIRDNPQQQQRVDSITSFVKKRIGLVARCIELTDENNDQEAQAVIDTRQNRVLMEKIGKTVSDIQNDENALLDKRKAVNEGNVRAFNNIAVFLIAGLFMLTVFTFLAVRYNLLRRIKLEEEVRETNRFLNTILEYIPNMIFVKDARDLRFVRFNRAGEKLLGRSRDELIGKNDYDFFPKSQADFFTGKDHDVLLRGELLDIAEEPIKAATGERWLHTKKIPINDNMGKPLYLLGISEDITEHKRHLDEISQLNVELEKTIGQLIQANKEMEAFTYSVSHDLRAPLRIIDGFGEILLKEYRHKLDEEGVATIKVIMTNAKHMGQLIDDLLNLSRLGRAKLSVKMVDMQEIVSDVIEALRVMDREIKAEIQIKSIQPIECDQSLVRQVWINLISNALKYSRKSAAPVVEIGSFNRDGVIVYYVKDNGVGFDMRYVHKLFGVFQRLHKISEFEGTGVGLALVHRIITKHGGQVWTEAKLNEGATFYFTLHS